MTTLTGLKNDWDSLAERDAMGAILTDPSRADGKWNIAEFMATGDAEIEFVINHLAGINRVPAFDGTALDFGCGIGRLTQPLARRFASTIGVDISRQMIQNAQSLNRDPRCRYVTLADSRLPFADESFSFIYSNIVLQHVPRYHSVRYLREFVRVLERGGILVFGVQDSFAAPDISSRMIRIRHILRIRSRLRSALGRGQGQMQMHCLSERIVCRSLGSARVVDIQLANTAAKDFNGRLQYLDHAPQLGYIGKQYCVVKEQ